jgi:hypothetical protein
MVSLDAANCCMMKLRVRSLGSLGMKEGVIRVRGGGNARVWLRLV